MILLIGAIEGIPALISSLHPSKKEQLLTRCSAGSGDLILFAVGHHVSVNKTLDRLRVYVAHELGLIDQVSLYCAFNMESFRSPVISLSLTLFFIFGFRHVGQAFNSLGDRLPDV